MTRFHRFIGMVRLKKSPKNLKLAINVAKKQAFLHFFLPQAANCMACGKFCGMVWKSACHRKLLALMMPLDRVLLISCMLFISGWKKWLWFGFRFNFAKKLRFSLWFRFYKMRLQFHFFGSVFLHCVLLNVYALYWMLYYLLFLWYDARNDVLPCWIGLTNCQPKLPRTRSAEIRHEEKILWLLILSCCKMNCEWDNVKNRPQTAKVSFLKTEPWKLNFQFWILRSARFGSAHCYCLW